MRPCWLCSHSNPTEGFGVQRYFVSSLLSWWYFFWPQSAIVHFPRPNPVMQIWMSRKLLPELEWDRWINCGRSQWRSCRCSPAGKTVNNQPTRSRRGSRELDTTYEHVLELSVWCSLHSRNRRFRWFLEFRMSATHVGWREYTWK